MKNRPSFDDIVTSKAPNQAAVQALADAWEASLQAAIDEKTTSLSIPLNGNCDRIVDAAIAEFQQHWTAVRAGDTVSFTAKASKEKASVSSRTGYEQMLDAKAPKERVNEAADTIEARLRDTIDDTVKVCKVTFPRELKLVFALAARQFQDHWISVAGDDEDQCSLEFVARIAPPSIPAPVEDIYTPPPMMSMFIPLADQYALEAALLRRVLPESATTWYPNLDRLRMFGQRHKLYYPGGVEVEAVLYVEVVMSPSDWSYITKNHSVDGPDSWKGTTLTKQGVKQLMQRCRIRGGAWES